MLGCGAAVAAIESARTEWRRPESEETRWSRHGQITETAFIALVFTIVTIVLNTWVFAGLDYLAFDIEPPSEVVVRQLLATGAIIATLATWRVLPVPSAGRRKAMHAIVVVRWLIIVALIIGALYTWAVMIDAATRISQIGDFVVGFFPPVALGVGISWGVRSIRRTPANDIQVVETLHWSWRRALGAGLRAGKWVALATTAALGAYVLLLYLLGGWVAWGEHLSDFLPWALFVTSVGALIGACFGGLGTAVARTTTVPNEGIRLSARNAALSAVALSTVLLVLGSLLVYLLFNMLGDLTEAVLVSVAFGATLALIGIATAGFRYGGLDVLLHWVLRHLLARRGYAPLRYARFLDYAAGELGFLQKVGGGYMFIHRYLLEHFAAMSGPGHEGGGGPHVHMGGRPDQTADVQGSRSAITGAAPH